MGVLAQTLKMKVLIVILVLTVALGKARKCYECGEANSSPENDISGSGCGQVVPGGSLNVPTMECHDGHLCSLRSTNGNIDMRGCSDLRDFPAGYEAVAGDNNKRCKLSRGGAQKDCLCNSDLCNVNTMAGTNTSNPSAIVSITLLTSLLLAKAIFM